MRCAHGDTVLYPVGVVNMDVNGVKIQTRAAVSENLPLSVLLGRDVPQLGQLFGCNPKAVHTVEVEEVLLMREKFEKVVQENMDRQKCWYDRSARERKLNKGDHVLVLLPTSSSKLLAQWQGPYTVIRPVGAVNYLVDMHDRRKRKRVFHVNICTSE